MWKRLEQKNSKKEQQMLISKFSNNDVEDNISRIEKSYGIELPMDYIEFLNKYNGGYTPKTKFKTGKVSSDIRGFYGVGKTKLSLDSVNIEEWLEKRVLPIACDYYGNYIVIGISKENQGEIFFCDHEKEYNHENVSPNLKSFIKACKSEQISEASKRSIKEREDALIQKGRGNIITDELRKMWQAEIDKYADMMQEEVMF